MMPSEFSKTQDVGDDGGRMRVSTRTSEHDTVSIESSDSYSGDSRGDTPLLPQVDRHRLVDNTTIVSFLILFLEYYTSLFQQ